MIENEILKSRLLLEEIKQEKRILEHERAFVTKLYEERIAKLNAEIEAKEIAQANILRTTIFDREEIMPILSYMVGLIEDKSYFYDTRRVPITTDFKGMGRITFGSLHPEWYYYHIDYLCESTSHAKKEIERFSNKIMRTPFDVQNINELLLEPKEHYVQIAFYTSDKKIAFHNNINDGNQLYTDLSSKEEELIQPHYYQGVSHIRDRKYLYIFDFIDYLSALLAQHENYQLTEKEMKEAASTFATEKKDEIIRVRKYL